MVGNAMRVTKRLLCRSLLLLVLALAGAAAAQEADDGPLVVNSRLVTLTVTVTDGGGRSVTGLDKSAFEVLDDKRPQEIIFFSGDDSPASVGVVFDLSGSMAGDKIGLARQALERLAETGHEADEYFLVGFDARASLLLDRTRDISALTRRIAHAAPGGGTALYDAVYLGAEALGRGSHRRRALVVVSDGEDNSSRRGYKELLRFLKEAGAPVYTVGILTPPPGASDRPRGPSYGRPSLAEFTPEESPSHRYYRMTLEGLAEATGGALLRPAHRARSGRGVRADSAGVARPVFARLQAVGLRGRRQVATPEGEGDAPAGEGARPRQEP